MGTLPVSKDISGRTSEHRGTTRSFRSLVVPDDTDRVQIIIRR